MSKYTYKSVTDPLEIDIDESWAKTLQDLDHDEQNNERKHKRPDHKYAPGEPLSLENLEYEGAWLEDHRDVIAGADLSADLGLALRTLTETQRRYFVLNRLKGYSCAEIARLDGKDESTVREVMKAAEQKIKKYFE